MPKNNKNTDFTPPPKSSHSKGLALFFKFKKPLLILSLSLLIATSAYAVAFRCIPCKQNHYCTGGFRYQCPSDKPVTQTIGSDSEDDCMSCFTREGSAKPAFDDLMGTDGDCVSCFEYDSTKPVWNGITCEACPTGTTWKNGNCLESCAYEIPHSTGDLCLVKSVDVSVFRAVAPQSESEEDATFKSTYGIVASPSWYPDCWAGAMKYCQDKGLRLPTMDEYISIMNAVYNTSHVCNTYCQGTSSSQKGCCTYSSGLSVSNQGLYNWLGTGSASTAPSFDFYTWAAAEYSDTFAYHWVFGQTSSMATKLARDSSMVNRAICIK